MPRGPVPTNKSAHHQLPTPGCRRHTFPQHLVVAIGSKGSNILAAQIAGWPAMASDWSCWMASMAWTVLNPRVEIQERFPLVLGGFRLCDSKANRNSRGPGRQEGVVLVTGMGGNFVYFQSRIAAVAAIIMASQAIRLPG